MSRTCVNKSKKKGVRAAGTIPWPQLASAGAFIELLDANGNDVGKMDPAVTVASYSVSDPSVLSVTIDDPVDSGKTTIKSSGKAGTVTITVSYANVDGSPSFPSITSDVIDVPAGPPTQTTMVIGTPS